MDDVTNCPDCARPVETSLLHDPTDVGDPVTIWDCSWCQRSGFVLDQPAAYVWPDPVAAPVVPGAGLGAWI